MKIPYGRQSIDLMDRLRVFFSLGNEFLTTGPLVEKFERNISHLCGSLNQSIVVSNGTAALHCAYASLKLKPGDEVITSPLSFIATAATASTFGARIRFADIQEDTGNIDPISAKELISEKTRAITAVDYAGHPADLDELNTMCAKFQLILIEDAAHSIGSIYRGAQIGSHADLVTFSFFPTKNITSGEGGAIVGNNSYLLSLARKFKSQGLIRDDQDFLLKNEGSWHQEVHNFGLNYRLPDILCALGLSQLSKIYKFKQRRKLIFDRYIEGLKDLENVILPSARSYVDPMWHLFPLRVDPTRRKEVFEKLRKKGIMVQVNYIPIYWHPVYQAQGYKHGECPKAEMYYSSEISLPMFAGLKRYQQEFVIDTLRKVLAK